MSANRFKAWQVVNKVKGSQGMIYPTKVVRESVGDDDVAGTELFVIAPDLVKGGLIQFYVWRLALRHDHRPSTERS